MVHRIRLKKDEPKHENQWSVYCKSAFNIKADKKVLKRETETLAREVAALVKAEGKKVKIAAVMKGRGMILVTCNDAFGIKLKNLPSADPKTTAKVGYYKLAS